MGPWAYIKHLMSAERLPFTAAYFGAIGLTLYTTLGVSVCSVEAPFCHPRHRLTVPEDAQHHTHPDRGHHPADSLGLVLGQLLPGGLERITPRHHLWGSESRRLDDRLSRAHALGAWGSG